jgi:hypothetical protein
MRLSLKLAVVAVLLLLLGLAVAGFGATRAPIQLGTREGYWSAATGVRKQFTLGGPSWCLPQPINGWFLYTSDNMHGSDFYRVPEADVLADFPKSVRQLDGPNEVVPEWGEAGFWDWEKDDPQKANPLLLLLHLREAHLDWWMKHHPEGLASQTQRDVDLGLALWRMNLFPLVQLAEWAYLSALLVFAAWPWLRNAGRGRWAVHVALLPPLLLLPYYLGYCAWNYTSAGPGGGVVYPFLLDLCRPLPWTPFDKALVQHVPQVLAPLTGPVGPMLSLSGRRSAGPSAVISLGLGLGAMAFGLGTLFRWLRQPPEPRPRRCDADEGKFPLNLRQS